METRARARLAHLLAPLVCAASASAQAAAWTTLEVLRATSEEGATLRVLEDGSILAEGANPATDVYVIELQGKLSEVQALRLEALCRDGASGPGPGRSASGNFVLSELEIDASPRPLARSERLLFASARADFEQVGFPLVSALDGNEASGWAISPELGKAHEATFVLAEPVRGEGRVRFSVTLRFRWGQAHSLLRLRWSAAADAERIQTRPSDDGWSQMQTRINTAIDRGIEYLLRHQELDGSWDFVIDAYRNGATALALYALLESGVPSTHPAVRRALEFLRCAAPAQTYSMACQLLALAAMEDAERDPWIQELALELLDWQLVGFGYPHGAEDISNTCYAALALRAAAQHGARIPARTWQNLAQFALRCQEPTRSSGDPAGFIYNEGNAATGARTANGIAILATCEEFLPEADPLRKEIELAMDRGLRWLAKNFSSTTDPSGDGYGKWVYYYLYGVERVGALLSRAEIGGHDWYREGARFLVDAQNGEGAWANAYGEPQPSTCFALLFLNRATAPATGTRKPAGLRSYGSDDPSKDVSLRAVGDTPLTLWISSFGTRALQDFRWPDDLEPGLRVLRVDYLLPDRALLPDAREGSVDWRYALKDPGPGFTEPGFDDSGWKIGRGAFGASRTRDVRVNTEWERAGLWMRHAFELDLANLVDPELVVRDEPVVAADSTVAEPALVCLYDESTRLVEHLGGGADDSVITPSADAVHGARSLRVEGVQRYREVVPGWQFRIARKPGPDEYRYVRFAWKKPDGGGIMVQLARNGGWGEGCVRYLAGPNELAFEPALQIAKSAPERWTVVTRDLYADCGEREGLLTGISFTAMAGVAFFDSVYLARSRSDFDGIEQQGIALETAREKELEPDETREVVPGESARLSIFVNGTLAFEGFAPTRGIESVPTLASLETLLCTGRNVIAVHARDAGDRSIDLGLRGSLPIARITGRADRASEDERFSTRVVFPRPGRYPITARVRVGLPGLEPDAQATHDLFSAPLIVDVLEASHPDLLAYASDSERNLLLGAGVEATASSTLAGWGPARAVDGLLALGWLSNDGDAHPSLSLVLARPVRANRIQLLPTVTDDPARTARIARFELSIDRGEPQVLVMDPSDTSKTAWAFSTARMVRRIDLRVLDRTPGRVGLDAVGWAEIELQLTK